MTRLQLCAVLMLQLSYAEKSSVCRYCYWSGKHQRLEDVWSWQENIALLCIWHLQKSWPRFRRSTDRRTALPSICNLVRNIFVSFWIFQTIWFCFRSTYLSDLMVSHSVISIMRARWDCELLRSPDNGLLVLLVCRLVSLIFDHFANHELLMTLLLVSIILFWHWNICCSLLEDSVQGAKVQSTNGGQRLDQIKP